jgi:Tfp pilus assembly ATPase PilU
VTEALRQRIIDRYDVDELIDIMGLSTENLLDVFDEEINKLYEEDKLDI